MKKSFNVLVMVFAFVFAMTCISCSSTDKFFKDYQKCIDKIELAASNKDATNYDFFVRELDTFEQKKAKLATSKSWTKADDDMYSRMTTKAYIAIGKLKLYSSSDEIKGLIKDLGNLFSGE